MMHAKGNHKCSINHEGSSGKMEADGAKQIWERSLSVNGVLIPQWLAMATRQHNQTVKDTYDGITVVKGECVGHVQNRVGKNLRNLTIKETYKEL